MNQESLTFDLANDCSRFVTGYFEIISTSSPHIYHSALALAAKTSMVRKIYESYARPFVRVVHGLSTSWDLNTSARTPPFPDRLAAWSPCNRFVAVSPSSMKVAILDSTTLQQLQIVDSPQRSTEAEALVFSPDSRMLTCSGRFGNRGHFVDNLLVVSWDLQTGGVVSAIERQISDGSPADAPHITYSANGKMVAIHRLRSTPAISIYDVVSGVYTHDVRHGANVEQPPLISLLCDMWTQGESLRFSTIDPSTVTIWEVGFAPGATSTAVETLFIPDNFQHSTEVYIRFLPTSRRHALVHGPPMNGVLMWDGQDSSPLTHLLGVDLNFTYSNFFRIDFSHDGRFLAVATTGSEIGLWKESSAGYVLHGRLEASGNQLTRPLLSPNGESIIELGGPTTRLWHTKSFTASPSGILNKIPQSRGRFLLEFHPDRPLAAVARWGDEMAIVLDLKSGISLLAVNAGMAIYGLRVVGNAIVVIGDGKVITWDLPGNFLPGAGMDVEDSAQTINFSPVKPWDIAATSISPDLRYVALTTGFTPQLFVHDTHTGQRFDRFISKSEALWFTPSGLNICYLEWASGVKILTVAEDGLDDSTPVVDIEDESLGCPWGSSRGYRVTDDRLVVGSDGKWLLMLPPPWQSSEMERRVWKGQFLALLYEALPEPVIIELEP